MLFSCSLSKTSNDSSGFLEDANQRRKLNSVTGRNRKTVPATSIGRADTTLNVTQSNVQLAFGTIRNLQRRDVCVNITNNVNEGETFLRFHIQNRYALEKRYWHYFDRRLRAFH